MCGLPYLPLLVLLFETQLESWKTIEHSTFNLYLVCTKAAENKTSPREPLFIQNFITRQGAELSSTKPEDALQPAVAAPATKANLRLCYRQHL
jgi:hypothetical protein